MTKWSDFSNGAGTRITTWEYSGDRGFLTNKIYAGGVPGPSYSYTAAGRLSTRIWARGITTTYDYNHAGDLAIVSYSDGATGNVTNSYNRRGLPSAIVCNGMTNTLTYNDAGGLLGEAFSGGTLNGLAVTNAFDSYLRRLAVGVSNQASTL